MRSIAEKPTTIARIYDQAQQALAHERLEDALTSFNSLLPLLEQAGDRTGSARILEQIGAVHELCGRLHEARQRYQAAIDQAPLDAWELQSILLHRLGHVWRPTDPCKSRAFFLRSAELSDRLGDCRGAALSRAMIGQIDFTTGGHEVGMMGMLTALVELPADAPERSHLIEHTVYLCERMNKDEFLRLVERHVPPGPLAVTILTARANRTKPR